MSLSRNATRAVPTKLRPLPALGAALAALAALAGAAAPAAIAAPPPPPPPPAKAVAPVKPASPQVDAELAVCPGQTFSQTFEALGDPSYYTLVAGSEFNAPEEGWELKDGAQLTSGVRPNGGSGDVLNLPAGAIAVSPAVCVTLQYPTARTWVDAVQGSGAVTVGVYYASSKGSSAAAQAVGQIAPKQAEAWELSSSFDVDPQLAGKEEGVREVRFVYANTAKNSDVHVFGLYVDPRMS